MDVLALLDRCIALERAAGEVYEILAARLGGDAELHELWAGMAAEEREHAHKLATWRTLAAELPAERRTQADGFEADVAELERLLAAARVEASGVADPEEAFAIALAIESSEIDAIYGTLLQSSPIARFPDAGETVLRETADHHRALVDTVRRRSRDEHNRLRAGLIAVRGRLEH
jgi:rubrerythrin